MNEIIAIGSILRQISVWNDNYRIGSIFLLTQNCLFQAKAGLQLQIKKYYRLFDFLLVV